MKLKAVKKHSYFLLVNELRLSSTFVFKKVILELDRWCSQKELECKVHSHGEHQKNLEKILQIKKSWQWPSTKAVYNIQIKF